MAAGSQKFKSDHKALNAFIAQQEDFGGNPKTFGQKVAKAASFLSFGTGIEGIVRTKAFSVFKGQNSHGVVTVAGKDGKAFQITRTNGRSPTLKDIAKGTKAAKGDAAAQSYALNSGRVVTAAQDDAGKLLDAPMKAGNMGGGGTKA